MASLKGRVSPSIDTYLEHRAIRISGAPFIVTSLHRISAGQIWGLETLRILGMECCSFLSGQYDIEALLLCQVESSDHVFVLAVES